jgi:hypothetical protein
VLIFAIVATTASFVRLAALEPTVRPLATCARAGSLRPEDAFFVEIGDDDPFTLAVRESSRAHDALPISISLRNGRSHAALHGNEVAKLSFVRLSGGG